MLPLYRDWCRPWDAIDQRELCLIFNRQTYSALFIAFLLLSKLFVVSAIHLKRFKATRLRQTSVSSTRRLRQRQLKPCRVSRLGLHNSKPNNRTQRDLLAALAPQCLTTDGWVWGGPTDTQLQAPASAVRSAACASVSVFVLALLSYTAAIKPAGLVCLNFFFSPH